MAETPIDARALAQAGIAQMRRGEPGAARALFDRIVAAGLADASVYHCLAHACFLQRDMAAALAAIDQALTREPGNLQSLILKGDLMVENQQGRAATAFYQAAVRVAGTLESLPDALRGEVARAQEKVAEYAKLFEAHLVGSLTGSGLKNDKASERFRHSLDLLLGKKQIYVQSPRFYYFPGLANIQFFERADFPWLDRLEAATAAIREELLEVMKDAAAFEPYVQGDPNRPKTNQTGLTNNPDWSAFYLWKNGEYIEENAKRCPRTLEALGDAPLSQVPGRSPSILFSLLRPGAHIPAHTGVLNTRLIGHLPLIVPPRCSLRVGNETRQWEEGKAWLFDDTIEHEAWNHSDQTRVILLFEVWRPELTALERSMVSNMLTSIDAYTEEKADWGD